MAFRQGLTFALAGVLGTAGASSAQAAVLFEGGEGDRAASALFEASGGELIVTLTNLSDADVLVPTDVLTAVFFDSSADLTLSPNDAALGAGSRVLFDDPPGDGGVGGEWAYRDDLPGEAGIPGDAGYGISSTGAGDVFGPKDRFPGGNLDGPASPNGLGYGITSAGDDPATGNTPVTGKDPLVRDQVVFTLTGLPAGFDPMGEIANVHFLYGTSLDEGPGISASAKVIPTPSAVWVGLAMLAGMAATRRCGVGVV